MAPKKNGRKSPAECDPHQRRFTGVTEDIAGTAIPTNNYLDYETESGGEFEITQPASGHDSFMYPSHTKGRR
jgi:hypothetical protein